MEKIAKYINVEALHEEEGIALNHRDRWNSEIYQKDGIKLNHRDRGTGSPNSKFVDMLKSTGQKVSSAIQKLSINDAKQQGSLEQSQEEKGINLHHRNRGQGSPDAKFVQFMKNTGNKVHNFTRRFSDYFDKPFIGEEQLKNYKKD